MSIDSVSLLAKRENVLREIVTSEHSYTRVLGEMMTVRLFPLFCFWDSVVGWIGSHVWACLFLGLFKTFGETLGGDSGYTGGVSQRRSVVCSA